jgi:hypothetical protein
MMRVCIHKLTQRLREAQSDARPGTLLANVAAAGEDPAQYEERDATPAEYAALLEAAKPPPTQDELDAAEARQYAKLAALRAMTPAQVDAWVDANVTDLASARDALKTLAIAVAILARRL